MYFERTREQYYGLPQEVRETGAWVEWIEYFLTAIVERCKATIHFTSVVQELQTQLRARVISVRRHASTTRVLEAFFHDPVRSVTDLCSFSGLTRLAVQAAVNALEADGILAEITGRKRGRVYVCRPVLDAIFES